MSEVESVEGVSEACGWADEPACGCWRAWMGTGPAMAREARCWVWESGRGREGIGGKWLGWDGRSEWVPS